MAGTGPPDAEDTQAATRSRGKRLRTTADRPAETGAYAIKENKQRDELLRNHDYCETKHTAPVLDAGDSDCEFVGHVPAPEKPQHASSAMPDNTPPTDDGHAHPAQSANTFVDDESDSDFEFFIKRVQYPVVSTTLGTRKLTKQLSLRGMLEAGKKHNNILPPSRRDPPRRTAQRPVHRPRDPELVPARWPSGVLHLADNFNPDDIPVPGMAPFQECYCVLRGDCRHDTCENARTHVYCDHSCCPFEGLCGNGTGNNDSVQLMRLKNTDVYALQAAKPIPEGVVIGEYLGFLSLVPRDRSLRPPNDGFRLHYHEDRDVWGSQILCVDAKLGGSLMRFINHSCTPTARFYEVTNEGGRIIDVTTRRDLAAGEEITVHYGDDLWFTCQCDTCCTTD